MFEVVGVEQTVKMPETINSKKKLLDAIENGARFLVFQYCISPLAFALTRFSPAILVLTDEDVEDYSNDYDRISKLFGWWSIPYGPRNTLRSIRVNAKGGINMTEDILLNLSERIFTESALTLTITNQWFIHPNRDVLSAFKSTVSSNVFVNFTKLIIGLYVNTDEFEEPYLVIGIDSSFNFEKAKGVTEAELYKHFSRYSKFTFVDLSTESDVGSKLITQGISSEDV